MMAKDNEKFMKVQQDLARRMTLSLNLKNNIAFLKGRGEKIDSIENF
jgi:hypothetical protein